MIGRGDVWKGLPRPFTVSYDKGVESCKVYIVRGEQSKHESVDERRMKTAIFGTV